MKFDHLQASIVNNNDQTPNLYMALCMMESLVLDMEDSSGNELSRCPAGDERLTSKLVWLCRIINDIYKDHDEDLQRNRSRLDKALEKLNDTQRELDALATVTEQLEVVQKKYNELDEKRERMMGELQIASGISANQVKPVKIIDNKKKAQFFFGLSEGPYKAMRRVLADMERKLLDMELLERENARLKREVAELKKQLEELKK